MTTTGGGSSISGGPGIALNKGGRYWTVNAGYDLIASRIHSDPVVGDSLGHFFGGGVGVGDPSIVRAGATYQFSRNQVQAGLLFGTKVRSQGMAFDITKQAFRWLALQGRWGIRKRLFEAWNLRSDSLSRDYLGLVRIGRLQFTWSRQIGHGSGWQFFYLTPELVQTPPAVLSARPNLTQLAASGVPLTAHGRRTPASASALSQLAATSVARAGEHSAAASTANALVLFTGADVSSTTLTGALKITRNATLRGAWQGQKQEMSAFLPTRFEQHNAAFEWRFRMVTIEALYYLVRFDLGNPIFRKLVMFKITRDFTIF